MYWKRLSQTVTLALGFSILGAGCSTVDALVNSPPGAAAGVSSPEQYAAIGRVFENQGHLAKAEMMYRRALQSDPGNAVAEERLSAIAARKSTREFDSRTRKMKEAVAVADSVATRKFKDGVEVVTSHSTTDHAEAFSAVTQDDANLLASLNPPEVPATPDASTAADTAAEWWESQNSEPDTAGVLTEISEEQIAAFVEVEETVSASVSLGDTGSDIALLEVPEDETSSGLVSVAATSETDVAGIATVGFEQSDAASVESDASQSAWKSSATPVSFESLTAWMPDAAANQADIVRALQHGENDGVKALAATVLIDCPQNGSIDQCLFEATQTDSDLLKVTALDALVQREAFDSDTVHELLKLLRSSDPAIQAQVIATLRTFAGTQWAVECAEGLGFLLYDDDPSVIAAAATTLSDFGEQAAGQRDVLLQLYREHDSSVVKEAAHVALIRIPAKPAFSGGQLLPAAASVDSGRDEPVYLPFAQ